MTEAHPITRYREQHNLSQAEFAEAVGVTRWTINRIECWQRRPGFHLMRKIKDETGIEFEQLRPELASDGAS